MKTKNILFVCKNNRFRSKIAKSYFEKINKNKNIKVSSAGVFAGSPITKKIKKIIKKVGLDITGKTRSMSTNLLKKQDLIIIVADDVPKSLFNNKPVKKIKKFKIKDNYDLDEKKILKIVKELIKKIDKLNKDIIKGEIKW